MNLIEENYKEDYQYHDENCAVDTSAGLLLSHDYSSTDGIHGEPALLPRLGDEYQVEIPPLLSETECHQLQNFPINKVDGIDFDYSIGKGLAIPITWVQHLSIRVGHVREDIIGPSSGSDATNDSMLNSKCNLTSRVSLETCQAYPQGVTCKEEIPDTTRNDISLPLSESRKNSYVPLPGSKKASWSDSESHSFLLGLYIFGKNLVQVQKFVESKDMGDVLSFYYGKFYRSNAQRRWVECRKTRGRRCILGHRIFTGWRQQELLSRLLSGRSKEVQDPLLEVHSFPPRLACL